MEAKMANLKVLILLVMEYPLGLSTQKSIRPLPRVLILLVMEYPLGQRMSSKNNIYYHVLILLVMEYPLGLVICLSNNPKTACLNPSCNGISSRTVEIDNQRIINLKS